MNHRVFRFLSDNLWSISLAAIFCFISSAGAYGANQSVMADYDGDGKADIAVWRPSSGIWYLQQSTKGFRAERFGLSGDVPIPNVFVH